jgi:hypothetical protein
MIPDLCHSHGNSAVKSGEVSLFDQFTSEEVVSWKEYRVVSIDSASTFQDSLPVQLKI